MKLFFKTCHLPENLDILFLLILGILFQMADGSPFSLKERWLLVWDTELPAQNFSPFVQKVIKIVLSVIVVIRCATTYAYVVSAMLVIFCLLRDTAPKLMLLWLLIAGIKSVCMTFIEALTGVYVCSAFGKIRKACIEFFISKALEIITKDKEKQNKYRDLVVGVRRQYPGHEVKLVVLIIRCLASIQASFLWELNTIPVCGSGAMVQACRMQKTVILGSFRILHDHEAYIFDYLGAGSCTGGSVLFCLFIALSSLRNLHNSLFAAYLWGSVQNIYQDMERKAETKRELQTKEQIFMQKMDFCRQRARSLVDESTLYKTACLNNFEFKDVPQIILQMLRSDDQMSQDSLLGPGMMLASVSNLGSFDHLKTSQSLGELGFMDLGNTQVVGLEDDENLPYREKALRFLKLTKSDVGRIRQNRSCVDNDIYTIDRDMWKQVEASGTLINKPKQPRTQVFIRDIQTEPCEENSRKKKSLEYKFGFSFSNLFNDRQTQFDVEQEEEFIFSHDEEDDDSSRLIMSNIKEGVIIQPNRLGIVFKKMKGNAYAELYRQDFMSVIGPEVFDRASKLPKMTSLEQLNAVLKHKPSISLPALPELKEANQLSEIIEKISQTPIEELQRSTDEDVSATESSLGENLKSSFETDSTGEENTAKQAQIINDLNQKFTTSQYMQKSETQDICSSDSEHSKITNRDSLSSIYVTSSDSCQDTRSRPCLRKRRIVIRRTRKTKNKNLVWDSSPFTGNSKNPHSSFGVFEKKDVGIQESPQDSKHLFPNAKIKNLGKMANNDETHLGGYSQQMYFLSELFNKPLLDVLVTYYDLRRRIHVQRQQDKYYRKQNNELFRIPLKNYQMRKYESIFNSVDFYPSEEKVWKSKVLKTVEAHSRENSIVSLRSVLSIIKRKSVLQRLFKYEYARLMSKRKHYFTSNYEVFLSRIDSNDPEWKDSTVDVVEHESLHKSNDSMSSKKENAISLDTYQGMTERQESNLENQPEVTQNKFSSEGNSVQETDIDKLITEVKQEQEVMSDGKVLEKDPEVESVCSQESDEPISLYYSKAANLASPLFDMKRFIYPDHIHYSYKHVKKKGFDVDLNGGFPLLMRESLTMGTPVKMGSKLTSKTPEFEITRRPMDLSFASTNAFAEWQNNYQNDLDVVISDKRSQKYNSSGRNSSILDLNKNKKAKKTKRPKRNSDSLSNKIDLNKSKPKNFTNIKYLYSTKDYALIEKLLKMHIEFNRNEIETFGTRRKPVQISSTQLHSNKGRINSTYNPAIFLQENKTRCEKRKVETQEERTKDMFARLEREALLHSKNVQKSFGPNRNS